MGASPLTACATRRTDGREKSIAHRWHLDHAEIAATLTIRIDDLTCRRQFVVNDVERLSFKTIREHGRDNGGRAVGDECVGQRPVRVDECEQPAEARADAIAQAASPGSVDDARADDDERQRVDVPAVLAGRFLQDLAIDVRAAAFRRWLDGTSLVEYRPRTK